MLNRLSGLLTVSLFAFAIAIEAAAVPVMQGFPPSPESQVTKANYLSPPFNRWAFSHASAPLSTLMVPRGGAIHSFDEKRDALESYKTPDGLTLDRKSTRLDSSHSQQSRMPSSA